MLTAIRPDRTAIDTKTFTAEGQGQLKAWLESFNGGRNIYFHVNPTINPMDKKAEREYIKALAWLHVDVDLRAGEDLDAERGTPGPPGPNSPSLSPFHNKEHSAELRMPSPTTQRALPVDNPRETTTAEPLRTVTRTA